MQMQTPPPLSAPNCDIRGYEFMPLFGARLFSSDFFAEASDLEFRAALRLWWAAWQQVPAGSLPNKDTVLARLAGFENNLTRWSKVKKTALHGFLLCSDGRLYHPMLCQQATLAFEKRQSERDRKRKMRAAKQLSQTIDFAEPDPLLSAGHPQDVTRMSALTGQDRTGQDRTGQENGEESTNQSIASYKARVAMLSILQQSDFPTATTAEAASPPSSTTADSHPENSIPDHRRQPTDDPAAGPLDQSSPGQRPPDAPNSDTRPRHMNPRACDPPHVWIGSGLSRGPDGMPRTTMDGMVPHLFAGRGIRTMVDTAARRVCEVALIEPTWRGDWETLVGWLNEGFTLKAHITPAITALVERQQNSPRGYRQPSTLRYFTAAIREYAKRQVAA